MDLTTAQEFCAIYSERSPLYALLAERATRFLRWRTIRHFRLSHPERKLPVIFTDQFRAKQGMSLLRNLEAGNEYKQLEGKPPSFEALRSSVKDLAAGRLIFFFRDDLDEFAGQLKRHKEEWFGGSAKLRAFREKKPGERDESFGYDSLHLTAEVERDSTFVEFLSDPDRAFIPDGLRFEIQLRTFFQHGWAEPEHELRYKVFTAHAETDAEDDRWWGLLAAMVEACDRILIERKRRMLDRASGHADEPRMSWRYDGFATEKDDLNLEQRDGVVYGYELLHEARTDRRQPVLAARPPLVNFELDAAMRAVHGIEGFKQRIWKQLKHRAPDFVTTMTSDERVVRVAGFEPETLTIKVEPAQYSDQMVTNHVRAHPMTIEGRPVRDLAFRPGGCELLRFGESPLANSIGISAVIRTSDGKWIAARRSRYLAHEPGSLGTSASGALGWNEPDHWDGKGGLDLDSATWQAVDFDAWVKEGMASECEEELGFRPPLGKISYLGFGRERARLGKPQLFFLIDLEASDGLDFEQLEQRWAMYAFAGEHVDLLPLSDAQARLVVGSGEAEGELADVIGDAMLSEELRFNLKLALDARAGAGAP